MVREFSEEKRQEIFRILDEIDMKEWKPFMEWCGSSAEEFGDWPERLNVSAYTRYVDEYHQKILDLNEMTRQQVNIVFENVAEINARYAVRMRECQEKIKEQIAAVRTMTEFMESMTDGKPNMALITKGSVNENCIRQERKEDDSKERATFCRSKEDRYIDKLYNTGWISEEEYRYLRYLLTTAPHVPESERVVIMGILEERLSYYRDTENISCPRYQWMQDNLSTLNRYLENNDLDWSDEIKQQVLSEYYDTYVRNTVPLFVTAGAASVLEVEILDWEKCQDLYDRISIKYAGFYALDDMVTLCDPLVAYRGYPQVETFDHTIQLGDVDNPYEPVYIDDAQGNQQANCYRVNMREREEDIEHPDWYAFMYRDLDKMEKYYRGTNILGCERSEDGLVVTLDDQTFFFHLENGWWMDENGRYLITVGPNVLNIKYNGGSLNFEDFSDYFGCRIDVILVNDTNPDDILTLECIYGGDIKAHTEGLENGVYMTGRSWLDPNDTATPDGSMVEFLGMPNDDNGIMSDYHVEVIIVYDNAAEVN